MAGDQTVTTDGTALVQRIPMPVVLQYIVCHQHGRTAVDGRVVDVRDHAGLVAFDSPVLFLGMGLDVRFRKAKEPMKPAPLVAGLYACVVTTPTVAEVDPQDEGGEGDDRRPPAFSSRRV